MSGIKALLEKRELECPICLDRFTEPKTLQCLHNYCLKCLQNLIEKHGKISCPKCFQTYDGLKKEDLKSLTSNKMISDLVEYVEKIESEKTSTCSNCENKPGHYCADCTVYLCSICIKQHKVLPILKDHSLYTLDKTDEPRDDKQCKTHCEYVVEYFCQTCNKIGCKRCEHVLSCYKNKHDVISMTTAVEEFNKRVAEVIMTIVTIKGKLKTTLDISTKDMSNFESQLKLCRTAIEIQEKQIITKVQEITKTLMADIEAIYKVKKETLDTQDKYIDSKLTGINTICLSLNTMMNKPEKTETLRSHEATINDVKDEVLGADFDKSFTTRNIIPAFNSNTHLYDVIITEGIGKLTVDGIYKIADDEESITVTKGQPFAVKVSGGGSGEAHQLSATLINASGEESATDIEDQGSGEYEIKGRCNTEGDWQMEVTAGRAHIKGSPVNVKVVNSVLVQTIDNISEFKEHSKEAKVTDVVLDADGCILVSSYSKDILKFNQSGLFVDRIQIPGDVRVNHIHQMDGGCMVYSNTAEKCVVMCDEHFQETRSFGKGVLQDPMGMTVNETTRIMYVADRGAHCVFKFNVDDGRLLGTIEGGKAGQMKSPQDVTLTKDGHVIITDCNNHKIQMFDAKDNFMRTIVAKGHEDGYVIGPHYVTIDDEENLLVSSNHKLQLFDKNGVFIKRIDNKDDGLDIPAGIAVISKRPRRVSIANQKPNNVKIFNY